ncbi:MAG: hypothetical protein IIY94_00545, partial [Oscillospiraceae bacterium]|nr:hypothetical protein [Oscillospiraceae bacterium]
ALNRCKKTFTSPFFKVFLHHHRGSRTPTPIIRQTEICFYHYTIADPRSQLPCFQREGDISL